MWVMVYCILGKVGQTTHLKFESYCNGSSLQKYITIVNATTRAFLPMRDIIDK